jgi:hypothetical protein
LGRPRKNRNLLEMSGTIRDHPGRYEGEAPPPETSGPIGDPPESFKLRGDAAKLEALWRKLVAESPIGILTVSDREYLETVCILGIEAKRIWRGQVRAAVDYAKALKGLGMTPEGRAIRGIGGKAPTQTANPLETFQRKRRRAI